ncbi:hypothetical protein FJ987_06310 [Mesorhizobium sp. CU2]|uniref:hypothetical protein n=1 Tax=unclassified Mesorhizobium TaxID=325217 RepID=UPI00112DAFAC|nr:MULTISPECIES: hypothetical protein [unclassified Mesorhizobium]TPN86481.1 hypothetical protein FJ988_06765 [Mesorhizobium sp. CU3]TPO19888.1 hypothetical protein FJ987_06310 [Mesorhizobium sp. CU2]
MNTIGVPAIGLKALRRSARSSVFAMLTGTILLLPVGSALAAVKVGDSIYNPGTGNFETVVQIPSPPNGWVVTAVSSGSGTTFNAVIVSPPAVNSTFVSGGTTYKVLSYTTTTVSGQSYYTGIVVENETDSNHPQSTLNTYQLNVPIDGGGAGGAGTGGTVSQGNSVRFVDRQTGSNGAGGSNAYGIKIDFGILGSLTIGVSGSDGQPGGNGPTINDTLHATESYSSNQAGKAAVEIASVGGDGGKGGDSYGNQDARQGGAAGQGGNITLNTAATITTDAVGADGVFVMSKGGQGGAGGSGYILAQGGSGGPPTTGGTVIVNNSGQITTKQDKSVGIFAQSIGGGGGAGGDSFGIVGQPGSASAGGNGGTVTVTNTGVIETRGARSYGIWAQSLGGSGGNAGDSGGIVALGNKLGSGGGTGNTVTVNNNAGGDITTYGVGAFGILAQSIGGGGGDAGGAGGLVAIGGDAGSGGDGKDVVVTNAAGNVIRTFGGSDTNVTNLGPTIQDVGADAIVAQSIGGGGGNGSGSGGLVAIGGEGSAGGIGGSVSVTNDGTLITIGPKARGIFAQSIGGGGGNGGDSGGLVAIGGKGSSTSNGGTVTVNNTGTITTAGTAIQAESIGGGGGDGGSAGGLFSIGGSGGGGGNGLKVTVNSSGHLTTSGNDAVGILAQSLGGGGGNGGGSYTVGAPISIAIGGAGAKGGDGGSVEVNHVATAGNLSGLVASDIDTTGTKAYGVFAQSVGGGGGRGGLAVAVANGTSAAVGISFALGGTGGPGGSSKDVTVNYKGDVTTQGNQAYGIFAQSVGGGGGDGGGSVAVAAGGAFNFGLAMGGKGGVAGDGDIVTVNTTGGTIETYGLQAYGIFAQSVGGGGGNGGFAGGGTLGAVAMSVTLGGEAGTGGLAKAVTVNNHSTIITHENGSIGINAQSLGGGGGNGGFAISGAIAVGAVSAAVGGHGGGGSNGGTVTVDNQGDIITSGDKAFGIFAQSVGGGGGNGGSAVAFTATASPDPAEIPTVAVSIAVGGGGGDGSIADTVHVTNGGNITTHGIEAHGIWAQSVGGGGGTGGYAASGSMAIGPGGTITVAVGGTGGKGETAGAVIVDAGKDDNGNVIADSLITTYGMGADGIRAQSIGGGGGDGGFAVGVNIGINNSELLNMNLGVTVGGSGGVAGDGSTATVNNWAGIRTYGDNAAGIFAQSAGGGGGDGGNAITGVAGWANATSQSAQTVNMSVAVGGTGGAAGDGQDVTVNNHGTIETGLDTHTVDAEGNEIVTGNSAYGIFAQSIGGGGGIGGRANSINVLVGKGDAPPGAETNIAMSVAVGGNGGGAGNGGHVKVTNDGNIITNASMSDGIYAESVGGGGGAGGNGLLGTGELIPVPAALIANVLFGKTKIYSNIGIAVGGQGGSTGTGGLVEVTNTGNITTKGSNSNGIFAQSVGGGGGVGGKANIGATGTVGIGGKGTSGGDGGIVHVTNDGNGTIETFGAASNGIFAQSIGGGGGVAGNVDRVLESKMGPIPALNLGIGLAFGQGGGNGGSGKDVTVEGNGAIITHGSSSAGIFAQSVGGGGGILGTLGNELIPGISTVTNWAVGSNGDAGDSGIVHVNYAGTIDTYGSGSIGIFAQSNGGKKDTTQNYLGTAGNVTVDLAGSVVTHEAGTDAIVAQSKAVEGNGDIAINLTSTTGLVKGGATDADHIGVGVWLLDGKNNTISNKGTITTASGTAGGWAILSGVGNEAVTNYGAVTGSFDLGAGVNSFTNSANAIFNAGANAKLGAGNLFADSGYFSPGGDNNVMTTNLVGNWNQAATGAYKLDVDLDPQADLINVTGTANLTGAVDLNIMDAAAAKPGSQTFHILHADGGVSHTGLELSSVQSAVAQYELQYQGSNDVYLGVDITFAPIGLTGNEIPVANAINAIQSGGPTSPDFQKIAQALYYIPTVGQLGAVYDSISGEGVSGAEQPQFDAYESFFASMGRQADFWRTGVGTDPTDHTATPQAYDEPAKPKKDPFKAMQPDQRRWSYWASAGGNGGEIRGDAAMGSAGTTYRGGNLAAGMETVGDPDTLVGFALGGSAGSFAVDDRETSGNIVGAQAGAYVARKWDQFYIDGALAFGLYNNNIHRATAVPGSASPIDPIAGLTTENWRSNFLSAGFGTNIEAGWRQQVGEAAITPFAGLQFAFLSMDAFDETSPDGGALGLSFDHRVITSLPTSLGLQVDTTIGVGDGQSLQAWGRAAWVHEFETDRSVKPSFQAAPGTSFVIQGASAAEDAVAVNAGLKMNWGANTSMFAAFDGKFGDGLQSYGGDVGFKLNW